MADDSLKPITEGTLAEKNAFQKAVGLFMTEDLEAAKTYAVKSVILPSIKKGIMNILGRFLDVDGSYNAPSSSSGPNVIPYTAYYNRTPMTAPQSTPQVSFDYADPIVPTEEEAKKVRAALFEILRIKGVVRVIELYQLCHIPTVYTQNDFGWYEIASSKIMIYGDRFLIKMPKPVPIR